MSYGRISLIGHLIFFADQWLLHFSSYLIYMSIESRLVCGDVMISYVGKRFLSIMVPLHDYFRVQTLLVRVKSSVT